MELRIIAIGRLKAGPEYDLAEDYLKRAQNLGRQLGFKSIYITEIDERKAQTQTAQHIALENILDGEVFWILDERGSIISSPEFADKIFNEMDNSIKRINILIGGADGLLNEMRKNAKFSLSFGKMVWPHMLVRVMLCEQIYRALSISKGLPYHRD